MDEIKDIAIIVPCKDLEQYIKPLLLSFHQLNLKNISCQFIFVLDDCQDKTQDIIEYYMKDFDCLIINCNVHSCGLGRNIGIENSNSKYIWFVDGDDWIIYPDVLQNCLAIMETQNLDIIKIKYISNFFTLDYYSMVWQYIFRRDFIGDLRFLEVQPSEDVVFMNELNKKIPDGKIIFYQIPSYFYNYERPGSNMDIFKKSKKEKLLSLKFEKS